MNQIILNKLKDNRQMVLNRQAEMVKSAKSREVNNIESVSFFFKVVANHFEEMSTVMTNKCIKSNLKFVDELNVAVKKAEYACAKPARLENQQYFSPNQQ